MNYYKILNKEENHNGLQYKTGLNIDPLQFDPSGDCEPGGIYFASKDILVFLDFGPWIRKVTLPDDAQIYKNPKSPEKWKADKVILGERKRIDINVIQELIDEGADPKAQNSYTLNWAVGNGYLEIVELLIKRGADPKTDNSWPLQWAARNGYLKIVKLLVKYGADPRADDSEALKVSSRENHLEVVKFLIDNGADPKADDSYALQCAAINNHLEIVKLLMPVSVINKDMKNWIEFRCENQEILNLIKENEK